MDLESSQPAVGPFIAAGHGHAVVIALRTVDMARIGGHPLAPGALLATRPPPDPCPGRVDDRLRDVVACAAR